MSAVPILTVDAVSKRWDESSGLAPTSLRILAGEMVALRGRSGSGKSTLLGIVAGWCRPDGGRVEWHVASSGRGPGAWRSTAIVPQALGLMEELTVDENVSLVVRLDRARDVAAVSIADLLERLDLAPLATRLPRELSLGQRQRVAVARAVVGGPRLVLADEPTSHQDAAHARAVLAELRTVASAGGAVLIASHEELVARAADRVLSLDA